MKPLGAFLLTIGCRNLWTRSGSHHIHMLHVQFLSFLAVAVAVAHIVQLDHFLFLTVQKNVEIRRK